MWVSVAVRWGWQSWVELPYKDWNTTPGDQANFPLWLLPVGPFTNSAEESEGCQRGIPPGKTPVSPDRRLLVLLAG